MFKEFEFYCLLAACMPIESSTSTINTTNGRCLHCRRHRRIRFRSTCSGTPQLAEAVRTAKEHVVLSCFEHRGFPKIGGILWGPYNKDPTILVTMLGSPISGNSHIWSGVWRSQPGGGLACAERGGGRWSSSWRNGQASQTRPAWYESPTQAIHPIMQRSSACSCFY